MGDFIRECMKLNVFKFGQYFMKQGVYSPIYIDLRATISYPQFVKFLAKEIWEKKLEMNIEADIICGVPYTALPIATAVEVLYDVPMVLRRKEVKEYGTKRIIEGNFKKGQKCLIIEDVVTSGGSVFETAEILKQEGLIVTDCIVILDREQGASENLSKKGIVLHAIYKLKTVLTDLLKLNFVSEDSVQKGLEYLNNTSFPIGPNPNSRIKNLSFMHRAELCSHPVLKKLFNIIETKRTNLCVAVDVVKSSELLLLVENLGPHICLLKTHIDIIENFSDYIPRSLKNLAEKYNFLILEDRKFADIGSTVLKQYKGGIYKIQDWADLVTVHSIPGDGIIAGLKGHCNKKACLLVAQMSSEGAITSETYVKRTVEIAENNKDFVVGFISQSPVSVNPEFVNICPGISLSTTNDNLGQQYKTPQKAIEEHGATIVIVGRGITKSQNVVESAIKYKNEAYQAYLKTVSDSSKSFETDKSSHQD